MESLNVSAMITPGPADWLWWPTVFTPSANILASEFAYDCGLFQFVSHPQFHVAQRVPVEPKQRLKNAKLPRQVQNDVKIQWRLQNRPLLRQNIQMEVKSRWRLQNRPLQKPLNQTHLTYASTWEKAPLDDDVESKLLLGQTSKDQWESDSTDVSDADFDCQRSLLSDHEIEDMREPSCVEEDWDTSIGWAHTKHSQSLDASHSRHIDTKFQGVWGRASIEKDSLTWNEGETVRIDIVSETQFSMTYRDYQYSSRVFLAELRGDGQLHWSDGDVWFRQRELSECASLAPKALPPWLQKRHRRSCGEKPMVLVKREPAVRNSHELEKDESSERQCLTLEVGHAIRSSPLAASAVAPVGIAVALAPTQQDMHRSGQGRIRSKADSHSSKATNSSNWVPPTHKLVDDDAEDDDDEVAGLLIKSSGPHKGIVKWFRGSYGWIDCSEVKTAHNDCDIFLHVSDCNFKPRQGQEVDFFLTFDDRGNPKAVRVTQAKAVKIISGRDYFAARDAKIAMRKRQ
mmetsp:Transcript_80112/g.126565  ORF Transcript_80112/g.126565 Transcript_80112/m.126565 type:complete len:514 (+) Transcript_80112:16-1557(+)